MTAPTSMTQESQGAGDVRQAVTDEWQRLVRQLLGVLRLELRRNLFGRRALAMYFLCSAPVGIMLIWALLPGSREEFSGPAEAMTVFAALFESFLRTSIFLSALMLFMSLFRSEILGRSLHYAFLTPIRRDVLVLGKYFSALLASCFVFTGGTIALFVLTCMPWGFGELFRYLFQGPGFSNLVGYVGVAMLGCAGYGAVFLLIGLFFRNPLVPAVAIWLWELINFMLPPLLKKLSVIFYLQSLYPIPLPEIFVAVIADPLPAWISVLGILGFTALVLVLAGWRARRMEINYSSE